MYCSIYQAVGIWDELREAMEGKNHFGSDTAEIYAYRLMPNDPSFVFKKESKKEDIIRASRTLVALIDMFLEKYGGDFTIDGMKYKSWLKKFGHTFDHRVHVKYIKKKKR